MLGVLASYSITVKELKLLFGTMKAVNAKWVGIFMVLFREITLHYILIQMLRLKSIHLNQ